MSSLVDFIISLILSVKIILPDVTGFDNPIPIFINNTDKIPFDYDKFGLAIRTFKDNQLQQCEVYFVSQNQVLSLSKNTILNKLPRRHQRTFIILHELGHCYDDDPIPQFVDRFRWEESFADVFALMLMYNDQLIDRQTMLNFLERRQTLPPDAHSLLPLNPKSMTIQELVKFTKTFRKTIF